METQATLEKLFATTYPIKVYKNNVHRTLEMERWNKHKKKKHNQIGKTVEYS